MRRKWIYTRQATRGDSFVCFLPSTRPTLAPTVFAGASMTLVGLLPPICDNGNMLVDGGYGASPSNCCGHDIALTSLQWITFRHVVENFCHALFCSSNEQVSAMLSMGASAVIASDVGSVCPLCENYRSTILTGVHNRSTITLHAILETPFLACGYS